MLTLTQVIQPVNRTSVSAPGRMVSACAAARLMGSLPSTALSRSGGIRRSRWRSSWLPAVLKAAASACKQAAATFAWDSPVQTFHEASLPGTSSPVPGTFAQQAAVLCRAEGIAFGQVETCLNDIYG